MQENRNLLGGLLTLVCCCNGHEYINLTKEMLVNIIANVVVGRGDRPLKLTKGF